MAAKTKVEIDIDITPDMLAAGLHGRVARTGPHHGLVHVGNEDLIGSGW